MIQYVTIDGKEYPFLFSFRALFNFMNGSNIQSLQEANQQVNLEFDSLLQLFEQASEKGVKKDDDFEGGYLTAEDIEDAIDEEPKLFMELQDAFDNSKVMKVFEGEEEEDSKKK